MSQIHADKTPQILTLSAPICVICGLAYIRYPITFIRRCRRFTQIKSTDRFDVICVHLRNLRMNELQMKHESFIFKTFRTKVEQQRSLHAGSFQIIDHLGLFYGRNSLERFQFDDNRRKTDEVRTV